MRSVDTETRQTMNSRRNFVNYATMTLSDGTVLELKPSDFRVAGQSFTDDWVDGDSFQLGTAIGKTATLLLDNTDGRTEEIANGIADVYPHGKFSEYDFYMAYFTLDVCLPEAYHYGGELKDQMIRIGTFTVTTPTSHGTTIEIVGVDNMYLFDRSFDECDLDFTTGPTLLNILNKCCDDVGIFLVTQSFDNQNIRIYTRPEDTTYRQVVSWIAQIAGCNAVITETGDLKLKSYDMSALNGLDGGSFTAIGEEFLYRTVTWRGEGGQYKNWGYNTHYTGANVTPKSITSSGKYKVSKVVVKNISNPSNFDAHFRMFSYDCYDGKGTNHYNSTVISDIPIVAGENIINQEFTIETLNETVFWIGAGTDTYMDPTASEFDVDIYLQFVSYADKDSADGGTFETERKYASTTHWVYDGSTTPTGWWYWSKNFLYSIVRPAGKYLITRAYVYNIVDPSHFNAYYRVQKSDDAGSTWTELTRGPIVAGDNIINFNIDIVEGDNTRYRIDYGQQVSLDPNASEFDVDTYFKADDSLYLNGDDFDGGDFTSSLAFHNLTSINGTSISTDDIQFTGVSIENETTSAHYPNTANWDYYALVIEENPFTKDNESTIASSIYNKISGLKFRPFETSSIQDPTIEAGDPCVIYDVKGNMYKSIITNVVFKTGGMTELSCHAEPPAKQGSRYSAPVSVRRAENRQTTYASQVAHFNEIANAALGYYKTEEVDAQTGAIITYLHDQPTLESSQTVIKASIDGAFISENGGVTYEQGYETSTGTMLLNLIYAHGITSDWIKTGTLDVGGVNNIDGIINVYNDIVVNPYTWDPTSATAGGGWWISYKFSSVQTYKMVKFTISNITDLSKLTDIVWQWAVSNDSGSTWNTLSNGDVTYEGDYFINYPFTVTSTTQYILWIGTYHVTADQIANLKFDRSITYTRVNTTIDRNGIETSDLHVTGGEIAIGRDSQSNDVFYVDTSGNVTARSINVNGGTLAGMTINNTFHGISFNDKISGVQHFFNLEAWGGITCGKFDSSLGQQGAWKRLDYVQDWGLLKVDYAGHHDGGIVVTNAGSDSYAIWGSHYVRIFSNDIYSTDNGSVSWSGSDRKLKKNIEDMVLDEATNLIYSVRPRKFEFKSRDGKRYGFIAQELREILDDDSGIEYVSGSETDKEICNINYSDFIAPLCMIVKDQQRQIDELKQRLDKLEGK